MHSNQIFFPDVIVLYQIMNHVSDKTVTAAAPAVRSKWAQLPLSLNGRHTALAQLHNTTTVHSLDNICVWKTRKSSALFYSKERKKAHSV